jgi:hypothetical protein
MAAQFDATLPAEKAKPAFARPAGDNHLGRSLLPVCGDPPTRVLQYLWLQHARADG